MGKLGKTRLSEICPLISVQHSPNLSLNIMGNVYN